MSATGYIECIACRRTHSGRSLLCDACRQAWVDQFGDPLPSSPQTNPTEDILQILRQQQTVLECLIDDLWHYSGHTERIPASRIGELGRLLGTAREILSKYPYKEKR